MVNLTYVLWVCAHSMIMLSLLMVVDSLRWVTFSVFVNARVLVTNVVPALLVHERPRGHSLNTTAISRALLFCSLKQPISQILAAINSNMFPVFIAANLATGAINISMRTLDADNTTAIAILAFYGLVVAVFALALTNRGLTIKV